MRALLLAMLVALLPLACVSVSLEAQNEELLQPAAQPPAHERFTTMLKGLRADVLEAANKLPSGDMWDRQPGEPGTRQKLVTDLIGVAAAEQLASSISKLKKLRGDVLDASDISSKIKTQVAWDMDRMVADAEKLNAASIEPISRMALIRALDLRFSVLLAPAFWNNPIKKEFLQTQKKLLDPNLT